MIDWIRARSRRTQVLLASTVVLVACCGGIGVVAALAPSTAGTGAGTVITPTAAPRPTATATANADAGLAAYQAVVIADSATVGGDDDAISTDCANTTDYTACRADAVKLGRDVAAFTADLDAHPAPPCLATADAHLRSGLDLFARAAQGIVTGIDRTDAATINQAASDMTAGNGEIQAANTAIGAAHC